MMRAYKVPNEVEVERWEIHGLLELYSKEGRGHGER